MLRDRPSSSESEVGGAGDDDLPDDLRAFVKAELRPGERLLWAARPVRPPANTTGTRAIAWGIVWFLALAGVGGAGGAYLLGGLGPPSPTLSPYVLLVVAPAGIGALVAALVVLGMLSAWAGARRRIASVTYALNSDRALLWRPAGDGGGAREIYTVPSRSLTSMHRVEFSDGSGDVHFGGTDSLPWNVQGFLGVADARRVESLAREILVDPEPSRRPRAAREDLD